MRLVPSDFDAVVVAGQSNGEELTYWQLPRLVNVAISGTDMASWEKGAGTGNYESITDWVTAQVPTKDVVLYWVHGEADALSEPDANAYQGRFNGFLDDLVTDLAGYSFRCVVSLLPTGNIRTYAPEVRAAQIAVVAARSDTISIDNSDLPLPDGVHYADADIPTIRHRLDVARLGLE